MKRGKRVLPALLLIISQLFLCGINQAQVDYFAPENVYRFAEYLYQEGDYLRAAGEFQRYLLLAGTSADTDSTLFRIGTCYRLGRDPQRGLTYFQRIVNENPQSSFIDQASYHIAYSYFEMKQYDQSIRYIEKYCSQSPECQAQLTNLLVVNHLYLKKWEKAHTISLLSVDHNHDFLDSLTLSLNRLALEGIQLPYKNTIKAALMSSLIPGTGKMYAHRFSDGLYSLVIVGLTGWQAYQGFNKDRSRSTRGWIYGTLCGGFYVGNVYGSIVAARIYNEKLENNLLKKLGVIIELYVH